MKQPFSSNRHIVLLKQTKILKGAVSSMSCGGNYNGGTVQGTGDCITSIVRNIVKAQHHAVEAEEDTCYTSCDRSVADLLADFEPNRRRLRYNTIPFMLYCKENCKPFIGSGFRRKHRKFHCVQSPVFRVKNFVKGSNHCVLLEILKPVYGDGEGGSSSSGGGGGSACCSIGVCESYGKFKNFKATGVCITVDLRCFCGITCLDPITPIRAQLPAEDC